MSDPKSVANVNSLLPDALASPLARLEPYGMLVSNSPPEISTTRPLDFIKSESEPILDADLGSIVNAG